MCVMQSTTDQSALVARPEGMKMGPMKRRSWRVGSCAALLTALVLAVAACGDAVVPSTPAPSTEATGSPPATQSAEPAPTGTLIPTPPADERFDLTGTAWRVTTLDGELVDGDAVPELEFDIVGRPGGSGFTGCDQFGFTGAFVRGRAVVLELLVNPAGCAGLGASLEARFLDVFQAIEAWSVDDDVLTMWGSAGEMKLSRRLPPEGDPSRELAEALHAGAWWIVEAPGITVPDRLSPIEVDDYLLIGRGICSFVSDLVFEAGGTVDVVELYWDSMTCGEPDERETLKSILDAVTNGTLAEDWTVRLSGPNGTVVLVQH